MLKRLQRFVGRRFSVHRMLCAATLLAYLASSIGLPIGRPAIADAPRPGCRCAESGSVNGCCCSAALVTSSPTCCQAGVQRSATLAAVTAACCSATSEATDKAVQTTCSEPQQPHECAPVAGDSAPSVGSPGCGCGDLPVAGIVVDKDPRMRSASLTSGDLAARFAGREFESLVLIPRNLSPDTPPPKPL